MWLVDGKKGVSWADLCVVRHRGRGSSLGMDKTWYPYINSLKSAGNALLTVKGIVRVCSAVRCIRHPRYAGVENSLPSAQMEARLGIVGLKSPIPL